MSKYAGTKTEKNLMEAFAGESMARNKYTYFASVAKKAGSQLFSRKPLTRKRNTQRCGSRNSTVWATPHRT